MEYQANRQKNPPANASYDSRLNRLVKQLTKVDLSGLGDLKDLADRTVKKEEMLEQ